MCEDTKINMTVGSRINFACEYLVANGEQQKFVSGFNVRISKNFLLIAAILFIIVDASVATLQLLCLICVVLLQFLNEFVLFCYGFIALCKLCV